MGTLATPTSHEAYIALQSEAVQSVLLAIQSTVERQLPQAQRAIGYGMPAYRVQRVFFYFAAFKHHIGIYPPITDDTALIAETAPFRNEKGNLRFPIKQAMPLDLIGRVAVALAKQYSKT